MTPKEKIKSRKTLIFLKKKETMNKNLKNAQ